MHIGVIRKMIKKKQDFGIEFDGNILFSDELNPNLPSLDEELYNLNTLEQDEGIEEDLEG